MVQRGYPKIRNYTLDTTLQPAKIPTAVQLYDPNLAVADPRPTWEYSFTVDTIQYWNYPLKWNLETEITLPPQLQKWLPTEYTRVRVVCRMDIDIQMSTGGQQAPEVFFTDLAKCFSAVRWLRETQRAEGPRWKIVRWFSAFLAAKTNIKYGCDIHYADKNWESGTLVTNITTEVFWYQAKLELKYQSYEPKRLLESKRDLFAELPYSEV